MLSKLAFPHIRCCVSAIPSDLMKSTAVDESLSSMNQQFCSRENQLLQILFSVFGFLWYCVDVLIYGAAVSLKNFFTKVDVSGIVIYLEFTFPDHFYINVTLSRLISLFMLIFFYIFLSGNFWWGCLTCQIPIMYNLYISQEYRKAWYV